MSCLRRHSKRLCWEGVPGRRTAGWGNPGEMLCPVPCSLGFMVIGLISRLSLANYSDSGNFLVVQALLSQNGCQWGGIWEGVGHGGVSFWPFLNSSGWWWHVSSVFLTRTSCPKITHVNGYYGDWPGWAVSVSVFPIRILQLQGSFFFFNQFNMINIYTIFTQQQDTNSFQVTRDYKPGNTGTYKTRCKTFMV